VPELAAGAGEAGEVVDRVHGSDGVQAGKVLAGNADGQIMPAVAVEIADGQGNAEVVVGLC
jgi:hypothetical protein